MAFNWTGFLRRHRIEYVTRGPSTSRDNVNVKCPLCGDADTGYHLGISLKGKGWNCWRVDGHKGKSRTRLIMLLLRVDYEQAQELAGGAAPEVPADEDVVAHARAKLRGEVVAKEKRLAMPPEFKQFKGGMMEMTFKAYLMNERGYSPAGAKWLASTYDLRYVRTGPFAWRIVFPIYDEWGRLLTWTGRSIRPKEELRYRALGVRATDQLPAAKCQPQETLLGLRNLWQAPDPKSLLVVEGPFDAAWINHWGNQFGVYATCLFGLQMSQRQAVLLDALGDRFPTKHLMLDEAASMRAWKVANTMGLQLPRRKLQGSKDPAELQPADVTALCLSLL